MIHTGSTAEFAKANLVKPQTVIVALSRHGHYMGVKPVKLANGRLVWPIAPVTAKPEVA